MPIDLATLAARTLGNAELQRDLLALFERHTPPLLTELRSAWQAKDWATLKATAHRLKGSAATIAAKPLADALLELETTAGGGVPGATESVLKKVEAEAKACLDQIRNLP